MEIDDFFNIDLETLKRKISELLGISVEELEEEIERIKAESKGMAGDRTAIIFLLDRRGYIGKSILERILADLSILPISDLRESVRSANIIARILRIFPEQVSKNNNPYVKILVDDGSGRAIVTLFGDALKRFKEIGFSVGDAILLKRCSVSKTVGQYVNLLASSKSLVEKPDAERYENLLRTLPEPPVVIGVREFLESQDVFEDGEEVNIRGVIGRLGELREFKKRDGSVGKRLFVSLVDENDPTSRIGCVFWNNLAEYLANSFRVGEIIVCWGMRVRKREDQENFGRLIELQSSRLTTVERVGEKIANIGDLSKFENDRVVVYGFIYNEPVVKSFTRDGEEKQYLVATITDGDNFCRVVVWELGNISDIEGLKRGAKVRVFGRVKKSNGRYELHISGDGFVEVNPENFPLKEIKILEEEKIQAPIYDLFENIFEQSFVSLRGVVEYLEVSDVERFPSLLILGDVEGNRVKIIGWDKELFERIKEIGIGKWIEIKNLKVDYDENQQEYVLKLTKNTTVKPLSREGVGGVQEAEIDFGEFVDARSILEAERRKPTVSFLSDMDKRLDTSEVIASIIAVNRFGRRKFCDICGSPMIDESNVCEDGHVSEGVEENYFECILEDGNVSYEAIVPEEAITKILKKYFDGSFDNFAKDFERILGRDFLFEIHPKIREDGKMYLIVKDVKIIKYEDLLEKILEEE